MTLTAVPELISPPVAAAETPAWMTGWRLVALWLVSGACLLAWIGTPTITRTQEARVLETAREMLDQPGDLDNWLIPELNGVARLRKPPLPYWFSAVAFMIGGVSEGVGRVPTAVMAWLLVGLTFRIADRLLDRRKAFFSAATLTASYLFFRHARLAETDMPAALFVTGAVAAFLRAAETRHAAWQYAAAICIGLAFNAKGPPGLFPLVFLLIYAAIERRWDVALRFVTSGAVLLALISSGAWYAYAGYRVGWTQFRTELREMSTGEGHGGPFYAYIPLLLQAAAPWSLIAVAGAIGAVARWKTDVSLRTVLIWFASILIPLSFTPQKQPHYAVPMIPPLMLLAGWAIDVACGGRATRSSRNRRDIEAHVALPATLIGIAVVAIAGTPLGAWLILNTVRRTDWMMAATVSVLVAASFVVWFLGSRLAGATAFAVSILIALPLFLGFWYPGLSPTTERDIATKARELAPAGPYYFYADMHLPLVFYLQMPIRMADTPQKLQLMLDQAPTEEPGSPLVIVSGKENDPKEPFLRPPAETGPWKLTLESQLRSNTQLYEIYRAQKK